MCLKKIFRSTPIDVSDEYVVKKIELQLHEQYAINNNSNLSSIIALIVAVLAVFGAWGYVYIHSTLDFAKDMGSLVIDNGRYTIDVLLIATIVTFVVIFIIKYFCLYQGVNQRMEQFIIHAIRRKYYKKEINKDDIYPSNYTPFGKSGLEIVQGLYGEIIKILFVLEIFIIFALIFKVFAGSPHLIYIILLVVTILVCWFSFHYCFFQKEKKYNKQSEEFKEKIDSLKMEDKSNEKD